MNARTLFEKWKRRIEQCRPGDDAAIRQVLGQAGDDIERRQRSLTPAEYTEVSVKVVGIACRRRSPGMTNAELQVVVRAAWDELAAEDRAAAN
jgi:hypothetical protein